MTKGSTAMLTTNEFPALPAPADLRCEYAANPLGIDAAWPRLSWILRQDERGQRQTAYQILVAGSLEALERDAADVWDSGKVACPETIGREYAGPPLLSRQRCFWKVRVWDRDDRPSSYSESASWEMGLLSADDWQARWIGCAANWSGRALYFRYDFALEKPIVRASAYVAGLGYYELRLNGQKVGDHVLDPGCTDYSRRVLYATYDVTEYLLPGANKVGAIVGHGWHGTPKLLLQLDILFADGTTERIYTDRLRAWPGWSVAPGPIVADSLFGGETYDARLEKPGWDRPVETSAPAARTEDWIAAMPVEAPGGVLVSQAMEPIRVVAMRRPQSVTTPRSGVFVFDTGQNLAGWVRLRVRGERGNVITLRFAEVLGEDGLVNQENLRTAAATDTYILKGAGEETWEPRFTYHGFRYVQVEGWPGTPTCEDLEIGVVRSDVASAGEFRCSDALLNRIQRTVWWTEASNLHSLPTDCPQRDERMGWLNDMTVRAETALYSFDLCRLYAKWVGDIRDAQCPRTGAITDTAPFKWGNRPADPVSVCYLLVPWLLYQHYGDIRLLAESYDGLKAWVEFLGIRAEDNIVTYSYWGDWAPPVSEGVADSIGASAVSKNTPGALMSTGFYFYSTRLLADIAGVLGHDADRAAYADRAACIGDAYNRRFWDEASGGYGTNNQACNAFSLYLGLVEPERIPRVIANLVHDVVELHDTHLNTGNLCSKYLLEVLTAHGQEELACRLALQETYPSWGYMVRQGATALWERWEYLTGGAMNSHNHPMLGSVGCWFYRALAGLVPDSAGPGWARFHVRPYVPLPLTQASARLSTVRGPVESAWERDGVRLTLRVTVPVGSIARVCVPVTSAAAVVWESDALLWAGGGRAGEVEGVSGGTAEAGYIAFEVVSGRYQFVTEPPA